MIPPPPPTLPFQKGCYQQGLFIHLPWLCPLLLFARVYVFLLGRIWNLCHSLFLHPSDYFFPSLFSLIFLSPRDFDVFLRLASVPFRPTISFFPFHSQFCIHLAPPQFHFLRRFSKIRAPFIFSCPSEPPLLFTHVTPFLA